MYSINLLPETVAILNEFKTMGTFSTLLGVFDSHQDTIKNNLHSVAAFIQKRKLINDHLYEVGKLIGLTQNLTTYVFRYTYANIAKQMGYTKDMIAEALGHSYCNNVTGIYLEMFDQDKLEFMHEELTKSVLSFK
ncbi:MAG: hypothetical protein RL624_1121 [Bacteroidota bacterium]